MSFQLDLSRWVEKAKGNMDAVVRKVVLDVGSRIVEKSPVGDASLWQSPPPPGYVGGRFRANWQYGFNEPPSSDLSDIDPSGGVSVSRISAGVLNSPSIGIHYLVNNMPYAKRLEEGWSKQAPQGMVTLTVMEFGAIASSAVKEVVR
jgi:hypothetical protein